MKRRRVTLIALTFAAVLTLLTLSLALAQSNSEELGKGQESAERPSGIPRTNGGPDGFGYFYADSNQTSCSPAFNDISGIGLALNLTVDAEIPATAPFPISLYDTTSTDLLIGNNGGLVIGVTSGHVQSNNNGGLPTTNGALGAGPSVLPFWDDLDDNNGNVYIATVGAAPNRQFIIQWHNRDHYNSSSSTATFQVVFYEGSRKINFIYDDVVFGDTDWDYGNSATIGLNQNGSNALQYSHNTPSILTGTNPVSAICFDTESLDLVKTVGTNPAVCATTDNITVTTGTTVYYCYEITNNAITSRTQHTLVDSELGPILTSFPFNLLPEATVWVTESAVINLTTVNTATWTATDSSMANALVATDVATVTATTIALEKTVGLDPATCATTNNISVAAGTTVFYCYTVTNNTTVTPSLHTLVDSELDSLLTSFPYNLAPNASVWLTESAVINLTTVNTATWTAHNPNNSASDLSATDSATVTILGVSCPSPQIPTSIYFSDFEADNGGGTGTHDWEWGNMPAAFPPDMQGAHSGTKAWATKLGSNYTNLNGSSLLTFTLDLSTLSGPVSMNWYQYLQANDSVFDFATITASNNILSAAVYTSSNTLDETEWTLHTAELDAYAGSLLTLVFDFYATNTTNDNGWYIDDLKVQYCAVPTAIELTQSELQAASTPIVVTIVTILAIGLTGLLLLHRRESENC